MLFLFTLLNPACPDPKCLRTWEAGRHTRSARLIVLVTRSGFLFIRSTHGGCQALLFGCPRSRVMSEKCMPPRPHLFGLTDTE